MLCILLSGKCRCWYFTNVNKIYNPIDVLFKHQLISGWMRIKVRSLLRYLTIIHIKFIFAINFKTVSKNALNALNALNQKIDLTFRNFGLHKNADNCHGRFSKNMNRLKLPRAVTVWKCPNTKFFWSVFSRIRAEHGELRSKSSNSVRIPENTDQKNFALGQFLRRVWFMKTEVFCWYHTG